MYLCICYLDLTYLKFMVFTLFLLTKEKGQNCSPVPLLVLSVFLIEAVPVGGVVWSRHGLTSAPDNSNVQPPRGRLLLSAVVLGFQSCLVLLCAWLFLIESQELCETWRLLRSGSCDLSLKRIYLGFWKLLFQISICLLG